MQPISKKMTLTLVVSMSTFMAGVSMAQDHSQHSPHGQSSVQKAETRIGGAYSLPVDIVSGAALAEIAKPLIVLHQGREFRFANQTSVDTFNAHPGDYLKKADAMIIEQQLAFYPVNTCPVSKDKLGEMGNAINYVYGNRLVRFCCGGCIGKFEKEPAKYLAELDKAVVQQQKDDYPLTTCVVSDKELGVGMGDPIEMVIGNRLIRLCCKGCTKMFEKNPAKFIAKLDGSVEGKTKMDHGRKMKMDHQSRGHGG